MDRSCTVGRAAFPGHYSAGQARRRAGQTRGSDTRVWPAPHPAVCAARPPPLLGAGGRAARLRAAIDAFPVYRGLRVPMYLAGGRATRLRAGARRATGGQEAPLGDKSLSGVRRGARGPPARRFRAGPRPGGRRGLGLRDTPARGGARIQGSRAARARRLEYGAPPHGRPPAPPGGPRGPQRGAPPPGPPQDTGRAGQGEGVPPCPEPALRRSGRGRRSRAGGGVPMAARRSPSGGGAGGRAG